MPTTPVMGVSRHARRAWSRPAPFSSMHSARAASRRGGAVPLLLLCVSDRTNALCLMPEANPCSASSQPSIAFRRIAPAWHFGRGTQCNTESCAHWRTCRHLLASLVDRVDAPYAGAPQAHRQSSTTPKSSLEAISDNVETSKIMPKTNQRCELCQKCKSLSKKCKIKPPFNFASFEAGDQWAPRLVRLVEKIITNHEF
jgi:hypothetical protein